MTLLAESRRRFVVEGHNRALRYLTGTAITLDLVVVTAAVTLSMLARDRLDVFEHPGPTVTDTLGLAGPLIIVGWLIAIALAGGYQKDVFGAGTDEYKRILGAAFICASMIGVGCYLAKFPLARGFFLCLFVFGVPSLILGRFLLRRALYQARLRGALLQRTIIAGDAAHVDEIASVLRREAWLGYQVVGALTPALEQQTETAAGVPVLGNSEQLLATVTEFGPDVIFFAAGALGSGNDMRRVVWDLEAHDVQVVIAPSVTDISSERIKVRPVGGLPLIHIGKPRTVQASRWAKRTFDIVGSLALLVVFAPVFAFAMLRIKLHDRGPVLFNQTRVGRDGVEFECHKFRTMVTDAEDLLAELHQQSGYAGGLFKLKADPRITKPGAFLRRYSLDELPQLLNVLRGDMSLVGPRPPLPREVANYEPDTVRRLRVRPGMTGLWQVSGRSDLSFSEAVRLDLFYVDNWSMLQDLTILLRTFQAVFGSRGAY
ncbi:sugar transferase [Nocardioides sp.]|uniref:sugar transferase n=1 Tax=Nocardioides sp. TaxID=35761 RepID=UPI0031FEC63C|nr:sugar transferase [Nocardioides sp.]